MKKKIFILAVSIVLTFIILAMILTPPIARWYINKNGKELVGRRINLDKIRINYATFTFRVIGFKLFEKDDSTVFSGFDTLLVDLQPLKLIRSELEIKRLWLIDPVSRITKRDTVFNFSDIIAFFSAPDTTAVSDTTSTDSKFKFKLSDIRLKEGHVTYIDEDIDNTTLLDHLNFNIPYLSWNQEKSSQAGLKFNFRNGGYFMADGTFDPSSGDFKTNITVNNLDISQFTAYIKPFIYLNSFEGLVTCNLNFNGNPDRLDSLTMNGHFSVNSFSATDNKDRKVMATDKLTIALNTSLPLSGRINIDSLAFTKPYLYFEMHDSTNNFIELLPPASSDTLTQTNTDTISKPLFYKVNSFSINDGIVDFIDNNLKEQPFKYHLSQIKLIVDSVSSTSTWLTAYSTMKLNEKGDLKAEIGINPSDPYELKVDYTIKNFQLPDITPYSKFYLGSAIVYGNLFYSGKTTITARQITSENKLIIRNAEIGKKSGGIFNLPLRLALYLIKDMNGDIKIDLPVRGDLNDPTIKIGKLIWTTFKNLIVKIAASPFIALSNLFGIDEKDIKQLDFEYADTLLSESNTKKLDQLLKIKEKKPELNIELAYFNDRTMEKEQLGYEEAGRIFKDQTGEDYVEQKDNFEAFLKRNLVTDTIDLYKDCLKLSGIEKIASITNNREDLRVKLVKDYLKSRDSTGGIKIFIPNIETIKNEGSRPVFEVKFSMEE